MKLSTGVDLVDIARIRDAIDRHGERFVARIFTETEQRESGGRAASLAARFAAKEAVAKALGCGIGDVGWLDIEIQRRRESRAAFVFARRRGEVGKEIGVVKLVCEFEPYGESGNCFCGGNGEFILSAVEGRYPTLHFDFAQCEVKKNTSRDQYSRDVRKDRLRCSEWRRTLTVPQSYFWSSTPIQRWPGITGR